MRYGQRLLRKVALLIMAKMNYAVFLVAGLLILAAAPALGAEWFDTHHSLALRVGIHNYFPDRSEHEGTEPNSDMVVTEDEWLYIWEKGYRIQDLDSATMELGYEYKFLRWLGVGLDMGFYGRKREYDFHVSGFDVESEMSINVFHFDLSPRFHWLTRWTDLYGGPVIGYYGADFDFKIDSRYGEHEYTFEDSDHGDGVGWGSVIGFEFRIMRYFGVALEDRLMIAIIDEFKPEEGGAMNLGGNVFTLSAIAHF